jgi:hypothetical protein
MSRGSWMESLTNGVKAPIYIVSDESHSSLNSSIFNVQNDQSPSAIAAAENSMIFDAPI